MADINTEKLKYFEIENFDIEVCMIFDVEQVNRLTDHEEIWLTNKNGIYNK
jgi:hypothetical protein